jgi:hypothetical protein
LVPSGRKGSLNLLIWLFATQASYFIWSWMFKNIEIQLPSPCGEGLGLR